MQSFDEKLDISACGVKLGDLELASDARSRIHEQPIGDKTSLLTLAHPMTLTQDQEEALYRKIDLRLMPILALAFFLNFLDRGNIGGAKIHGLSPKLSLTGPQYNAVLTAYFIPFCLLEFPSNLVLKSFRPSRWLPFLVMAWGAAMTVMGFVKTYPQLVATRVCIGAAEAGLAPGVAYYLSFWYPRPKLQFRTAVFLGSSPVASASAGLLAFGISYMDGTAGLEGWSWIFILEGSMTVIVGIIAAFIIVDCPATAAFLSPEERAYVSWKIRYSTSFIGEEEHLEMRHVWAAFCDWQTYCHILIYMSAIGPMYAVSLVLSSIIETFGYAPVICNLLVVPPFIVGSILLYAFAIWSDTSECRSPFIIFGQILMLVGFSINIMDIPPRAKYAGIFLCVAGACASLPGAITWLSNNVAGQYKRGVAIALQIGIGNAAGAITSNVYRDSDAPRFIIGHGTMLLLVGLGLITALLAVCVYACVNRRRDIWEVNITTNEGHTVLRKLGDRAPSFRYML